MDIYLKKKKKNQAAVENCEGIAEKILKWFVQSQESVGLYPAVDAAFELDFLISVVQPSTKKKEQNK